MPLMLPSPGVPCTFMLSGNSRSSPRLKRVKPRPSWTLLLANQAPRPSLPLHLYTEIFSGLSLPEIFIGLPHSFCSAACSGEGGKDLAEDEDISEALDATDVTTADRGRVETSSGGGTGTDSNISSLLANRPER